MEAHHVIEIENQDAFMCLGDIDAMAEEDVEQYLFFNMVWTTIIQRQQKENSNN